MVMNYIKRNRQNVEETIQKVIDDEKYNRKLIIILGEYGIGKTALYNEVLKMLDNKMYLSFSLNRSYNNSPVFLRDIIIEFIERLGVDEKYSSKKINLIKGLLEIIPDSIQLEIPMGVSISKQTTCIKRILEQRWESYISKIENIESKDDFYIRELVLVVQQVLREYEESELYIVIDNFEYLDRQSKMFMDNICYKIKNVFIILTMETTIEHLKNKDALDFISEYAYNNKFEEKNLDIKLEPFDDQDTMLYLSQYPDYQNCNNLEQLSEKAVYYSGGLPLFLSILCQNKSFLINDNLYQFDLKNIGLEIYYRNFMDSCNKINKKILFYLTANGGSIDKNVLLRILKSSKTKKINRAFSELCTSHVLEVDALQNCVFIKAVIFYNYISCHVDEYKWNELEYRKDLWNAYIAERNIYNISEKYIKIVKLAICLSKWDEAYKYALEGSLELKEQMKYDVACKLLEITLDKAKLSPTQKLELQKQLIGNLYNNKEMERLLEIYDSIIENTNKLLNFSYIHLKAAKAQYYLNHAEKSIILANQALQQNVNSYIYFEAKTLISSAYDLIGDYEHCFSTYDDCIYEIKENKELNPDNSLTRLFNMVIQMRSNKMEECVDSLLEIVNKNEFEDDRIYACGCNNLGIEYLMGGKFQAARKYLQKAEELFERKYHLEKHFVLNNLGLYYLYSPDEHNEDLAMTYFDRAFEYAISPLQYAYILLNKVAVYLCRKEYEQAIELLVRVENHVKKCPDPIVKSYFHYNYAYTLSLNNQPEEAKEHLRKSYCGLEKPQLGLLYKKRDELAISLNCKIEHEKICITTNRRKFWSEQKYEPCELMFYN